MPDVCNLKLSICFFSELALEKSLSERNLVSIHLFKLFQVEGGVKVSAPGPYLAGGGAGGSCSPRDLTK